MGAAESSTFSAMLPSSGGGDTVGVLGTVVAVGTLLIFVLPAVMTVVIETTALRELSGQMADKLQEAVDEEAQVTESPLRVDDAGQD